MNGKALMAGVNLLEMEASDMVDVLHFQFEEYFTFVGEEHVGSASGIRKSVWNTFYGVPFKYEIKTSAQTKKENKSQYGGMASAGGYEAPAYSDDDFANLGHVDPFSPREQQRSENGEEIKPYFPPTDFDPNSSNPFPGLDGPLN